MLPNFLADTIGQRCRQGVLEIGGAVTGLRQGVLEIGGVVTEFGARCVGN